MMKQKPNLRGIDIEDIGIIGIHVFLLVGTPATMPSDGTLQPTAPCNCGILEPWKP